MPKPNLRRWIPVLACSALISAAAAGDIAEPTEPDEAATQADEAPTNVTRPLARVEDRMTVLGDRDSLATIPGSAHLIGLEELERQEHSDVHRILRQVPGLNLQEEEGYGLRHNIGLRGTGVECSQKITLLEDGVLIAPAPYTAPSAYYFPTAARMEAFEVRKGSSAVRQGPYTNGGAINLISRSIPGGRCAATPSPAPADRGSGGWSRPTSCGETASSTSTAGETSRSISATTWRRAGSPAPKGRSSTRRWSSSSGAPTSTRRRPTWV